MFTIQYFKNGFKSEFLRNVLTLFTGVSISQIIPILISPILSRIYSPEQFGELGVILSVIGIFSIVATFQYEAAIMLPKKDEDAFSLLILAFFITVFISLLSFIITGIFGKEIGILLNSNSFYKWTFIIPFFVFLTGLFNSLNIWTSRKKQYKRLAYRQIAQTTAGSITKLVLGWMKYLNSGLIWGTIAGQVTSTGVLSYQTVKENKSLFKSINIQRIKKNAFEYKDFPKYTMWQGFFDLANASGVIFILSYFYGIAVVGLYSFTLGLLHKPTRVIGQAVSQVFYQNASKKSANNESIYTDVIRLIKNLGLIGSIIFLPLLLFGPQLFDFIFGHKWYEAGVIAQILSPWFFLKFITSPLSNLAMVKRKQKIFLYISTGMNIIIPLIILFFGLLQKDYIMAFITASGFMVIYFLATIRWIINIAKW